MNPFPLLFPQAILFSTLIIFLQPTFAQDLINSTCNTLSKTDPNINYNFCTTSLDAATSSQVDLIELGRISITLVHDNLTDTKHYIAQLLNNGTWDSYTRQCLKLYEDAIADSEDAMAYYEAHCLDDANTRISSVMTDVTTCEEGYGEGGATSPLTKRYNDAFQLSAIALGIMQLIVSTGPLIGLV